MRSDGESLKDDIVDLALSMGATGVSGGAVLKRVD